MTRIGIIVGSTRPGRNAAAVARWVEGVANRHDPDTSYGLVDLNDFALPHLDEPAPAAFGEYTHEHTRRWAAAIAGYDGYIFVTPEYNHSFPGPLKNAIDFLYAEWHDKAAGFVSYGVQGGIRAAEQLRQVLAETKVATVRTTVALNLFTDFDPDRRCAPADHQEPTLTRMLDEIAAWAGALRTLRVPA